MRASRTSPTAGASWYGSTIAGRSSPNASSTSRTSPRTSSASSRPGRRASRSRRSSPAETPAYNSPLFGRPDAISPRLTSFSRSWRRSGCTPAAVGHRQVVDARRPLERAGDRGAASRRALRARVAHEAHDRLRGVRRAARAQACARPAGERIGARMESAGLAHVHRAAPAGHGGRAHPRHGGAIGQRCLHCACRGRRRQRGSVRADDEPRGGASGHEEHEIHECLRAAGCAALQHGAGSLYAGRRADPRFPEGVRAVLLAKGVSVQQHHPAQPQSPAVDRPERGRGENGAYRRRRLLPDRFFESRRPAPALGADGLDFRGDARAGVAQAPQLGLPVLRQREALRCRHAGALARGLERRRSDGESGRRQRPFRDHPEGRRRQAEGRARVSAAPGGAACEGAACRHGARDARRQGLRRISVDHAGARRRSGILPADLGYTAAMAEMTVFLNGKLAPIEQATVSVLDRGFIFGDGVYELVPVYSRVPFRLEEHLARLERSLGETRIRNPYSRAQWRAHIYQLIAKQPYEDQGVYFQVTSGVAKRDHAFPQDTTPTVFIMANPLVNPTREAIERGAEAVSAQDNRWQRCDIKSISLVGNVLLRQLSADAGAVETILFRDGCLTEASASNVFVVRGGVIQGPP